MELTWILVLAAVAAGVTYLGRRRTQLKGLPAAAAEKFKDESLGRRISHAYEKRDAEIRSLYIEVARWKRKDRDAQKTIADLRQAAKDQTAELEQLREKTKHLMTELKAERDFIKSCQVSYVTKMLRQLTAYTVTAIEPLAREAAQTHTPQSRPPGKTPAPEENVADTR